MIYGVCKRCCQSQRVDFKPQSVHQWSELLTIDPTLTVHDFAPNLFSDGSALTDDSMIDS